MKKYFLFLLLITAFASCKKIINVDLNNAPSQVVIEGIVNDINPGFVTISKSVTFSNDNIFPAVSGASVSIKDDVGNNYTLTESTVTKGTYTNASLIGVSGRTYTMTVVTDGKTYTATSAIPALVNLDSLKPDQIVFGNTLLKVIVPVYTDPAGRGNYYQFVESVNSRLIKNVNAWYDNVNDGGTNTRRLIYNDPNEDSLNIKTGDTVSVEMRCIDKNIFTYMAALADLNGNQTTPSNPVSNISNGALGYFSAHTSRTKKVVMP
jgi:hypothetical protein